MSEFQITLNNVFSFAKEFSKETNWDLNCAVLKLEEEFGELSECTLILSGLKPHKTMNEPILGEIADNIIAAIDIISHVFNNFEFLISFNTAINDDLIEYVAKDLRKQKNVFIESAYCSLSCEYEYKNSLLNKMYKFIYLLTDLANHEKHSFEDVSLKIEEKLNKWKKCGRKLSSN